jgi:pSer/pThr/pTyr-binding forkhead associated (FHA) protein
VVHLPSAIVLQLASSQSFTLRGKTDYVVGRIGVGREPPDVDLAPWYGYEGGVSREHMAIHVRQEGVFVEDLDSRNETIHNGFRLMPLQWYPLRDGDEIRLGAITLRASLYYV